MRLKVLLPTRVVADEDVQKISAEAENGCFTLLPRHIDFVTSLVPGLLSYETEGKESFLATDEGILVKAGEEVFVSVRDAVGGVPLGEVRAIVEERFLTMDERERKARSILAKFEADFVRSFLEMQKNG